MKKGFWHHFGAGTLVVGSLTMYCVHLYAAAHSTGCGSLGPGNVSAQIAHAPTLSLPTVEWELANRQSPLIAADASFIVAESQRYTIDDAFALADWASETQDGRQAVPGTRNIGNITAAEGVPAAGHIFAVYPTWQAGIDAWFVLIARLYIQGGHASDLLTFALFYVDGLTPAEATAAQKAALTNGYIHTLTAILATLQQHEAQGQPGGTGSPGSGGAGTGGTTLASLVPAGLPPGWAGAGVLQAAASILLAACTGAGSTGPQPLVLSAVKLGASLGPDASGFFDRSLPGAPAGVISQAGTVWCTDFVASVYQAATGKAFPSYPDAALWWDGSVGHTPGFVQIPAGPGSFPEAGDIVVLQDGAAGHVAIILGVELPQAGQPGLVIVAQAHATHVLEVWRLAAGGTLTPPWGYPTHVPGYLRIPALARSVAARVQPIIQWDANAGYDSRAQRDLYWDSDCAAAVLTEVLRASFQNVRIGQVIDDLSAAGYLTPTAGLTSQHGWSFEAKRYGLSAQEDYTMSYQDILRQVAAGIPVVVGLRAPSTSGPYPAFVVGHFLVVVGGDSTHLQVVDSSFYRINAFSSSLFASLWTHETILITAP